MSLPGPNQKNQGHIGRSTMVLPLQMAGMSPLCTSGSIWKQAPYRDDPTRAHLGAQTTGHARLFFPKLGRWPLLPVMVLDLDLDFDHLESEGGELLGPDMGPRGWPEINQPADQAHPTPCKHLCASEGASKSAGAHSQASLATRISDTARQTQVHEFGHAIHRLMPPDRTIYFGIDEDSFRLGGVPQTVTDIVIASARKVMSSINAENLGISFAYGPPSSGPRPVFDISYDPGLSPPTLARAFFPSDPRGGWKLGISSSVVISQHNLRYLDNILGHEFAHILGLRHWHAHTHEVAEPSFHWPNTERECERSIMVTGVDFEYIRFSKEDFRVIREMYSLPNGYVLDGRQIVDVDPY